MLMIGTNHEDLQGPERLKVLLHKINPEKITIEAPQGFLYSDITNFFEERKKLFHKALKEANISDNAKSLHSKIIDVLGYEIKVSFEYASLSDGKEIHYVDHPDILKMTGGILNESHLSSIINNYELFENNGELSSLSLEKIFFIYNKLNTMKYYDISLWEQVQKMIEKKISSRGEIKLETSISNEEFMSFMNLREKYMADLIMKYGSGHNDVHIGGAYHIIPELKDLNPAQPVLYEHLGKIVSKQIKLCEAEVYVHD